MKQYLKMADVLPNGVVISPLHSEIQQQYADHAINSHDELVQMNQELLVALEQCAKELAWMIDQHNEQYMEDSSWKYDHQTPWEAMQLVVKAKGGAV